MLSSSILTTSLEVCHQTTTSKLAYGSQMFVVVCIYSILLFFLMPTLCNRLASRQSFKQRSDMNRIDNQVVNERRRWALMWLIENLHRRWNNQSWQKSIQAEQKKNCLIPFTEGHWAGLAVNFSTAYFGLWVGLKGLHSGDVIHTGSRVVTKCEQRISVQFPMWFVLDCNRQLEIDRKYDLRISF